MRFPKLTQVQHDAFQLREHLKGSGFAIVPSRVQADLLYIQRTRVPLEQRMAENGRRRSIEFGRDRILTRWSELLFRQVPHLAAERPRWSGSSLPHSLRFQLSILHRLLEKRPAR